MTHVYLQETVDDIRLDSLPVTCNAFDPGVFSREEVVELSVGAHSSSRLTDGVCAYSCFQPNRFACSAARRSEARAVLPPASDERRLLNSR